MFDQYRDPIATLIHGMTDATANLPDRWVQGEDSLVQRTHAKSAYFFNLGPLSSRIYFFSVYAHQDSPHVDSPLFLLTQTEQSSEEALGRETLIIAGGLKRLGPREVGDARATKTARHQLWTRSAPLVSCTAETHRKYKPTLNRLTTGSTRSWISTIPSDPPHLFPSLYQWPRGCFDYDTDDDGPRVLQSHSRRSARVCPRVSILWNVMYGRRSAPQLRRANARDYKYHRYNLYAASWPPRLDGTAV
ncbi:unnamed protein product [Trichogramma brassicae]|uniref:Uncharacterized protein n=1 Tax=Trichogramma brassicae TaxID=86971 RepID=A0A6H5HUK8_9HYME|nr:unnamed protein product [Trichogramma brassicae]